MTHVPGTQAPGRLRSRRATGRPKLDRPAPRTYLRTSWEVRVLCSETPVPGQWTLEDRVMRRLDYQTLGSGPAAFMAVVGPVRMRASSFGGRRVPASIPVRREADT